MVGRGEARAEDPAGLWAEGGEGIRRRRGAITTHTARLLLQGPSRPRARVISPLVSKASLDTVVIQVGQESKRMATQTGLVNGRRPRALGAQEGALCAHMWEPQASHSLPARLRAPAAARSSWPAEAAHKARASPPPSTHSPGNRGTTPAAPAACRDQAGLLQACQRPVC